MYGAVVAVKVVSVACRPGQVDDERKGRGYGCNRICKQGGSPPEFGTVEASLESAPGRAHRIPLTYYCSTTVPFQ